MEPLARRPLGGPGHGAITRGGDGLERAAHDAVTAAEWRDLVDEQSQVQGVQDFGDDVVNLRVVEWVDAGAGRRFERHLRRRLRDSLDRADVEMPNRQLDVRLRHEQPTEPGHAA